MSTKFRTEATIQKWSSGGALLKTCFEKFRTIHRNTAAAAPKHPLNLRKISKNIAKWNQLIVKMNSK